MNFEPRWIAWESTRRCNLSCIHCRSSSENCSYEGEYTTEEAKELLARISRDYKPVFVLSGGEPLLREDIFEIATFGTQVGLKMCLATNGTLIDDGICREILRSGIKVISLSLDGPNARVHDDFRRQDGAFDGVLRGIEFLKRYEIPFIINSSFTKRNQKYIEETYRLAKKLGARAWYMFMIVPTGRGEDAFEELIDPVDYEKILVWHYYMEKDEKEMLVRPTCAPQYYRVVERMNMKEDEKLVRRNLKFGTGGSKGCIAAQYICFINNIGDVYPCSYFPFSAGNLREKSFKEIWENSELFKDLRDFGKYKDNCGACEYLNICGGCRARAYAVKGDYLAGEPYCRYVPEKLRRKE